MWFCVFYELTSSFVTYDKSILSIWVCVKVSRQRVSSYELLLRTYDGILKSLKSTSSSQRSSNEGAYKTRNFTKSNVIDFFFLSFEKNPGLHLLNYLVNEGRTRTDGKYYPSIYDRVVTANKFSWRVVLSEKFSCFPQKHWIISQSIPGNPPRKIVGRCDRSHDCLSTTLPTFG